MMMITKTTKVVAMMMTTTMMMMMMKMKMKMQYENYSELLCSQLTKISQNSTPLWGNVLFIVD